MTRVMLHAKNISLQFWAEAINTACHIHNWITTYSGMTVTLYELWKVKNLMLNISMCVGSICYILTDREYHRKWDAKSDTSFFLGYSQNNNVYRVFNTRTKVVMETINILVNDNEQSLYRQMDDE